MIRREPPLLCRSSVAVETVFDNEDLLLQILLRLPKRSLVKFKSVSKRCHSLISSRRFLHQWSISHPLTHSGIFLVRRDSNPVVFDFLNLSPKLSRAPFESETFDFTGQEHEIEIIQSCNGLLLCNRAGNECVKLTRDCYIYNLTTKQFASIPHPRGEDGELERWVILSVSLAFDPSRSSNYQVVFVQYLGHPKYRIKIYSSESGRWRSPRNDVFEGESLLFNQGVYSNNAIHWIINWKRGLYLDLCEDELHEMPIPRTLEPDVDRKGRRIEYFGDCGGHLYLIEMYDLKLDVWEMQEDHSGWIVKYHLDDLQILKAAYRFSVLAMIDRIDQLDEEPYLLVLYCRQIVQLNLTSGSFERVMDIKPCDQVQQVQVQQVQVQAYVITENLASVCLTN